MKLFLLPNQLLLGRLQLLHQLYVLLGPSGQDAAEFVLRVSGLLQGLQCSPARREVHQRGVLAAALDTHEFDELQLAGVAAVRAAACVEVHAWDVHHSQLVVLVVSQGLGQLVQLRLQIQKKNKRETY